VPSGKEIIQEQQNSMGDGLGAWLKEEQEMVV
jgi:hypothetical protein